MVGPKDAHCASASRIMTGGTEPKRLRPPSPSRPGVSRLLSPRVLLGYRFPVVGAPRRVMQPWLLAGALGLGLSACAGSAPSKPAPVSLPAAVSKTEQIATGRVTETLSASQGGQSLSLLSYRFTFDNPHKLLIATVDYRNIVANQPCGAKSRQALRLGLSAGHRQPTDNDPLLGMAGVSHAAVPEADPGEGPG